MSEARHRSFTLFDAMMLIMAIAVGLGIPRSFGNFFTVRRDVDVSYQQTEGLTGTTQIRISHAAFSASDYMNRTTAAALRPLIKGEIILWGRRLYFWPGPFMAALSVSTFVLSLGQRRRRTGRPTRAMSIAVILAMAVAAVRLPSLLNLQLGLSDLHWREWWLEFWFTLPRLAGFAVAVAWITLATAGRWRARNGWLDRLGTTLGTGWITMAVIDLATTWYYAIP